MKTRGAFTVYEDEDSVIFEVNLGGTRALRFTYPDDSKTVVALSVYDEVGELEVSDHVDSVALSMLSDAIELIAATMNQRQIRDDE